MIKNIFLFTVFFFFFTLNGSATIPKGAIPFIFDKHLYLQCTLNDSIPVTIIYDNGADFLYLDDDFLKINNLNRSFGRIGKAKMGGAGNSEPISVDIFIDPVKIHCGELEYKNKITPIIKLRDILGRHTDGLLGNTHLLNTPLKISFSEGFIYQFKEPLGNDLHDEYIKLDARFEKNRIDVKAKLQINENNFLDGWFRMDLGCGSTIILTNEAVSSLNINDTPKAYFTTRAGGVGGGSNQVSIRAKQFCMTDTLKNIVIDYSINEKGALSFDRPYLGLIGNKIWSLYDIILDPENSSVWVKRNKNKGIYMLSSVTHMATIDRTDICEGWIVNGLYKDGIAEKAGFEIGDIIIAINNRPVKDITWEEQRNGFELCGKVEYTIKKSDGRIVTYTLFVDKQII